MLDPDIEALLGASLTIGFIGGIVINSIYNNFVSLLCVCFIGGAELGTKICEFIDKGLFFSTGDIGFLGLDMESIIFKLLGIDDLGIKEAAVSIAIFSISFWWQRKKMMEEGKDLNGAIVDDRKKEWANKIWKK